MLDYEWGMLSATVTVDEPTTQPDHHHHHNRHIFDHYSQTFTETTNNNNSPYLTPNEFLHNQHNPTQTHHYLHNQTQTHPHFTPLYDPRAYPDCASSYPFEPDCSGSNGSGSNQTGYHVPGLVLPKAEPAGCAFDFTNNRIGLNLGGRTYFSSAEDDFVNRLYRRSRPLETAALVSSPRCQAEGCNADLTNAKHYHRRHKVCEFHSKASTVITAGLTQRFCQQCSRFHLLSEFDNGKRSCRKRLADHNRRRRKSSQNHDHNKSMATASSTQSSSSEIISRYQSESRV